MNLFKKNTIPPLTYIQLTFNLTAMASWMKGKTEIEPRNRWERSDKTIEHNITLLPQDPFLFYHDDKNQFSPSIGGYQIFENDEVGSVEWSWNDTHFILSITDKMYPVFIAPLSEVFYLLSNKQVKTDNLLTDIKKGSIISIEEGPEYCKKVHKDALLSDGIRFSNALAKISVVCVTSSNLVQY